MFEANSTIGSAFQQIKDTAADLIRYLRRPQLRHQIDGAPGTAGDVARLLAVNLLAVLVVASILLPLMMLSGVEMSSGMAAIFDQPVWQILVTIVIAGPIFEELIFRSWLSGLPRLLIPWATILLLFGGALLIQTQQIQLAGNWFALAAIGFILLAALYFTIRLWRRAPPRLYERLFPIIFWAQALLFGSVHLFNYAGDQPLAMLPFVLPQIIGGLIWGYARIYVGWWANIVMHMTYNLVAASGILFVYLTNPSGL